MKLEEVEAGPAKGSIIPVAVGAVLFPLSTLLWIFNHFFPIFAPSTSITAEPITPMRCFLSVLFPVLIATHGLRKKSLNVSGCIFALFVGFFLTMSNYCFMGSLLTFFFSSSRATKFRSHQKRKFEQDFKEGGQRNWVQVVCNGGVAVELALIYLIDCGCGERTIDFAKEYRASWLSIAVLGAVSCANGDTWASELGSVIKSTTPRLITTFKKVPTGTNGGVTVGGLAVSAAGGCIVGLAYYLMVLFTVDVAIIARSPPQWPLILIGTIGGLLGSVIDSYLGATLQFSGQDSKGVIHEVPGPGITPLSGFSILDNHSVNLISTLLTALLLPNVAKVVWNWTSNL